ncbi:MAG: pyridoxine 5'-phosphate synthase [Xanthomonadaceae bacterium]|nr:pyridoxine 5'-phosphate synthase [Xanthomonadaceae bacterium]MDE2177323.1 pyridoxine 5'-phosphate synthase [Xanthomonadaceae bacterium]MDE2244948.1 pyridoxine 5'-phosphate synthase [Xanthomonadaceae bacterium]
MIRLSVNLNKIAVLRNSRGGNAPDLATAAETCMAAGCGGITVHPRPDRRHIRPEDVTLLAQLTRGRVEFNIEGNPFARPRAGYPGLMALIGAARPQQVTLVPDSDGQLTSDHGFEFPRDAQRLAPVIDRIRALGARVSLFVDADAGSLEQAAALGAARIEIYTGPYAHAFAAGDAQTELTRCANTARRAGAAGLGVNAGHDLSQANLAAFCAAVPGLAEVSIGHALISEALYAGLTTTVQRYRAILAGPSTPESRGGRG